MTRPLLRPDDLVEAAPDAFRFYNCLPGDGYDLAPEWPTVDLRGAAGNVAQDLADRHSLDLLAMGLLANRAAPLPSDVDWLGLADDCARAYAAQLAPGGQRAIRMRLQRLNFMLRCLLDLERQADLPVIAERRFEAGFTWDWLPVGDGELLADSRQDNIHYNPAQALPQSARLGLPTQIDALDDGVVAVGSCYSEGWAAWRPDAAPRMIARARPVVLVFDWQGDRFELGVDGVIRRHNDDVEVARMPLRTIWCARRVGRFVIASDWADAGVIAVLDLDGWHVGRVPSGPVLVLNDICQADGRYYLIDKMRGRISAFGEDFTFLEERMSFGDTPGKLFDPISIRVHQGNLHVLSWVTGALVSVRPF